MSLVLSSILGPAVALVLAAAPARADEHDGDAFHEPRTEVGFGMLAGAYSVGPVGGGAVGLHLDLGRQMGPVKLYGEYDFLSIGNSASETDPVRGLLHRGGLMVRYNFAEVGGGPYKPIQGAFWLEGGAGRQFVHWDAGGVLERDDVAAGFGGQFNFLLARHSPHPKVLGFYYAFRAFVARSPDAGTMQPATCGGPCDRPTSPSPYDLGLFFNMGLQFGH